MFLSAKKYIKIQTFRFSKNRRKPTAFCQQKQIQQYEKFPETTVLSPRLLRLQARSMVACRAGVICLRTIAPAKRSQHANTTYRNIVGRNMLRAFGHPVAICMLRHFGSVVGSNLTIFKLEPINNIQHVQHIATGWPNVCNILRQQCFDMLHWNVAIV